MKTDLEKVVIDMKNGKMAILTIQPFDSELNMDDILRIDYSNIMGEILTFPLMFNRVANFKAEMENVVSEGKLDLEVFEAQLTEEYRKKLAAGKDGGRVTATEVESAVKLDSRYSIKKKWYFKLQKDLAYMDSLYWACQSKDTKLNRFSEKIRPEEFEKELLEDTINGIAVKIANRAIN